MIILKSVANRGKAGVGLYPPVNPRDNKIFFSDKAEQFGITHNSKMVLSMNTMIDENDELQMLWLEYAKLHKIVADSLDEANKSEYAYFYIHQPEAEAERNVTNREAKLQASLIIKNASLTKKRELAKLLGFNADSMSEASLTDKLYIVAETSPKDNKNLNYKNILSLTTDNDYKWKLLFANLKFNMIIVLNEKGYHFNSMYIGFTEEDVIQWLKSPENSSIVESLITKVSNEDVIINTDVKNNRNKGFKAKDNV